MGLEDFSTGNTTKSRSTTNKSTQKKDRQSEDDEPFKVITCDKGRKKVFPTEDDWNETVQFIEDQMGMSISEVLNRSPENKYQLLHKAILKQNGSEGTPFHPTNQCIVCGEDFVFPESWNFTRIRGEAVCNDHDIGEAIEAIGAVNAIKG